MPIVLPATVTRSVAEILLADAQTEAHRSAKPLDLSALIAASQASHALRDAVSPALFRRITIQGKHAPKSRMNGPCAVFVKRLDALVTDKVPWLTECARELVLCGDRDNASLEALGPYGTASTRPAVSVDMIYSFLNRLHRVDSIGLYWLQLYDQHLYAELSPQSVVPKPRPFILMEFKYLLNSSVEGSFLLCTAAASSIQVLRSIGQDCVAESFVWSDKPTIPVAELSLHPGLHRGTISSAHLPRLPSCATGAADLGPQTLELHIATEEDILPFHRLVVAGWHSLRTLHISFPVDFDTALLPLVLWTGCKHISSVLLDMRFYALTSCTTERWDSLGTVLFGHTLPDSLRTLTVSVTFGSPPPPPEACYWGEYPPPPPGDEISAVQHTVVSLPIWPRLASLLSHHHQVKWTAIELHLVSDADVELHTIGGNTVVCWSTEAIGFLSHIFRDCTGTVFVLRSSCC